MADCLARDSYMLSQHNRDEVAAELLGVEAGSVHTAVSDLPSGSDNRTLVIALALVLASLEARTGKDAWRHPAPVREPGDDRNSPDPRADGCADRVLPSCVARKEYGEIEYGGLPVK